MISSDVNMMRKFNQYFGKLIHASDFALQNEKKKEIF